MTPPAGTPRALDNQAAAERLALIGDLIELCEDQPFKARAYHRAARTLKGLARPAETLYLENALDQLPGFGRSLVETLGEFFHTGTIRYLEELQERVPDGVLQMRRIPGLGPGKVKRLFREHGIDSLSALRRAAEDGTLAGIAGFGAKSVARIRKGIDQVESFEGFWRLPRAFEADRAVRQLLADRYPEAKIETAGELRRHVEIVGHLGWVVCDEAPDGRLAEQLAALPVCQRCAIAGKQRVEMNLVDGVTGEIRFVPASDFGRAVIEQIGPAAYAGFVLARTGTARGSEADLMRAAGLPYLPPECRDRDGFWTAGVPGDLLERAHLRGVLHCHSSYSDGHVSVAEMARACVARGYAYLGMCDHSRSAAYAGGLSEPRIREQQQEIDRLNASYAGEFRIFKGIESDIRADGSLDYPDEVLRTFDFIIASVHSGLDMDADTATERLCRAMANPFTTILGHPTGRLLLARDGYPLHWERVIETAAEHGVALELNANPRRLDTDWRVLPACFSAGVKTAINPDAHDPAGIDDMSYGVNTARIAGATPEFVLNCLEADDLAGFFAQRH